jgi:DNA-binding HxlR family transcriptional regulator/putative sterol carrier protein
MKRELVRGNPVPEHRYQQYCALARALDIVGDRWTLLIVRELVPGPRRFTDLLEGLPGVSRNLLTERLRGLEGDRIVARRELPAPAARLVYELTAEGRDLADAIVPLMAWGVRLLGEREATDSFHARWAAWAMASFADRAAAEGVSESYQYLVGDSAFYFTVDDSSIELHDGRALEPAVVVTTDEETWADIASGKTKFSAADATGALTVAGHRHATMRMRRIFSRKQLFGQAQAAATGARHRE